MQRPRFVNGAFYHVYNRGVEKRRIFQDNRDHARFIHDLFEFNDIHAAMNLQRQYGGLSTFREREKIRRDPIVDIVAFVLMPNHYHLLLQQRKDEGIPRFLQKLGTGYTLYFNLRYERSGVLFQGRYKVKSIERDNYLRHLIDYIHLNPTELFRKRRKNVQDVDDLLEKLNGYRWSSYRDYSGSKNFPSILSMRVIEDLGIRRGSDYQGAFRDSLKRRHRLVAELPGIMK